MFRGRSRNLGRRSLRSRAVGGRRVCLSGQPALSGVRGARPAVRPALADAWVVFPDGASVAWLQRRTGARSATRIAGTDLMTRVFSMSRIGVSCEARGQQCVSVHPQGYRVFLGKEV